MTAKIFTAILSAAVVTLVAAALLFIAALYDYFGDTEQTRLKTQTEAVARGVEISGKEYLAELNADNLRVTWIAEDGGVLYESIPGLNELDNHMDRPEVIDALHYGYGSSTRYSDALGEILIYSAQALSDGSVIRLSVTQSSLFALTLEVLPRIVIIIIAAVILSAFLASRLSKKIIEPLNKLNLDDPLTNDRYDELSPLLKRIDAQHKEIKKQNGELKRRQNEFDTLTSSMSEGIVLLNSQSKILSINNAAARILGTESSSIDKNLIEVNRDINLTQMIKNALCGTSSQKIIKIDCEYFQISASPIFADSEAVGAALIMLNVTEKEMSEEMRREFTANVSHELKTPLQTILGNAELLANGMVKQEDVSVFSERIYTETKRMNSLIDDILKLSHLDEGIEMTKTGVDLYETAQTIGKLLAAAAEQRGIQIRVKGETGVITGIKPLIEEIIYNLTDNAIKYNKEGGYAEIEVNNADTFAEVIISDNGIGIPKELHQRIFERFYRVDKSRSKEIGGTGLGLSIVKRAVALSGASIQINSQVDLGTEFIVRFPKT